MLIMIFVKFIRNNCNNFDSLIYKSLLFVVVSKESIANDSTTSEFLFQSSGDIRLVAPLISAAATSSSTTGDLIEEAKNDVETDLNNLKKLQLRLSELSDEVVTTSAANSDVLESNTNTTTTNNKPNENYLATAAAAVVAAANATTTDDQVCKQLETSLNDLQSKIEIKKRLINELEVNTKSLELMRVHYEEKMSILHDRIKQIEDERDRVIFNMSNFFFFVIDSIIELEF
jgi:chromosome segregation ATPase